MKPVRLIVSFIAGCSLLIASCARKPYYAQQPKQEQYVIEKGSGADSALVRLIAPYKRGVDTQMQVVIGRTDIPLTKAQPESTLGNFMADAMLVAARKIDPKVVAAVSNYGGIRINYLAPGPITRGNMYELMPFDNMLTVVQIPGSVLQELCDAMARSKGWPVSGLSFAIKDKKADNVMVGGKPLDPHLVYRLAVNDYMARGGDYCDFLIPLKKKHTTVFVRDALIDYVSVLQAADRPLHPVLEKRIVYAE